MCQVNELVVSYDIASTAGNLEDKVSCNTVTIM